MMLESKVPDKILLQCSMQEKPRPETKIVTEEIMRKLWVHSDFRGKVKRTGNC